MNLKRGQMELEGILTNFNVWTYIDLFKEIIK